MLVFSYIKNCIGGLAKAYGCNVIGGEGVSRSPEQLEDQGRRWRGKVHGGPARARYLRQVDLPVLPLRRGLQWGEHTAGNFMALLPITISSSSILIFCSYIKKALSSLILRYYVIGSASYVVGSIPTLDTFVCDEHSYLFRLWM